VNFCFFSDFIIYAGVVLVLSVRENLTSTSKLWGSTRFEMPIYAQFSLDFGISTGKVGQAKLVFGVR